MPREIKARQRVSQACIPCGQRKTKCDGAVPVCNQCAESSRCCHYGISRRNKTRKSTATIGDRLNLPYTQPASDRISERNNSSASASTSEWTRGEEEASSISANLNGNTSRPHRRGDATATNVSSVVSSRLFTAYFTNIHPIWPILYMPMHDYMHNDLRADAFTPAVLYAVYSIAACLDPIDTSPSIAPEDKTPPTAVFFEAALLALQKKKGGETRMSTTSFHPLNFIRPSIESCQTLVILALHQHGLGEASNAAMLCNIAAGMAMELRLNEAGPPEATYVDTQVASRLWWNLYVLDKVLACALGRPVILRSEDITTPYPSAAESDEYQLLPYKRPGDGEVIPIKSHTMSGFNLTIDLCFILEDILRATCSVTSKQRLCKDLEAAETTRMSLWARLQSCEEAFKSSTIGVRTHGNGFRAVVPPVAIIDAVYVQACVILLHRPFQFYWREYNWSPAQGIAPERTPIRVCIAAAQEGSAILAQYVDDLDRLPCDFIFPIVLVAGTLWQYHGEYTAGPDRAKVQEQIDLCVKCLAIMGKSWKSAGDHRQELIRGFAGAASTPAPTTQDTHSKQHTNHYNEQLRPGNSVSSGVASDVTTATLPLIEGNNLLHDPLPMAPIHVESTFPFLDALAPRLDEFTTADEGFRAYLKTQLGQYDFPVF